MKVIRIVVAVVVIVVMIGCKSEPFPKFEVENHEGKLKLFVQGDFGLLIYHGIDSVEEVVLKTNNQESMDYWINVDGNEIHINPGLEGVQVVTNEGCWKVLDQYSFDLSIAKKIEERRFRKGAAINQPILIEKGNFPVEGVLKEFFGEQLLKEITNVCK